ncbi:hypothetical protein QTP86_028594, partial [Hemibagrus guttatus]
MFFRVEVRTLCRPVKFLHTKLPHPRLYGPCFVHWCAVMLEQEGVIPKLFPQSWEHEIVQNVLKKTELTCPRFDEYKKGICGTRFSYQDLCHAVPLTPSLKESFEARLGELTAAKFCEFKACPGCLSNVERADKMNLCVHCTVCTARLGYSYEFCWNCRRKWEGTVQIAVRCGHSDCDKPETSQKKDLLKLCQPAFKTQKLQTEQIYQTKEKSNDRKRLALIINNVEFRVTEFNRRGAEKDEESMRALLEALDYDVIILNDLSAEVTSGGQRSLLKKKLQVCESQKSCLLQEKYVRVVQDMYERSRTVVRCAVGQTEEFKVEVGLHQGSALSPFLFAMVMDQLSEEVRQESPWTMMFADDIVICSESREQVEENLERWRFALERRGMKVSHSKTEYMCVNEREGSGTVRLQGEEVKKVQEFKYLGSTVQRNGECGKEGMEAALRDFSQHSEHRYSDSTFIVIMSHGGPDGIYGINYDKNEEDVFPVDKIFHYLGSLNCPGLTDKPKIILIQACRGDKAGHVWVCDSIPSSKQGIKQHREKDFACFRSCTPDTISMRNTGSGSVFIQNLVKIFNDQCHEDDIVELFRK